ncbi:MAG: sigma-70 family RNA polymerase sigma factor [Lachnospiraceae bacterium]|nr:sigma-70 family RNA polymerase sigma factor [Lachnospiraceae bacterium]
MGALRLKTDEIIDKYADMVYRIAVNETGNREDAQDIFQEVFLRLVRYRDRISNEEHLKAWLIRVTINCAKKQKGSFWNRKVTPVEKSSQEQSDERTADAYEAVENADSPVLLAVRELPEKYRSVVYLFYYEEMSIAQIGKLLGEKESTVKSRLHRAREILKMRLKGEKP